MKIFFTKPWVKYFLHFLKVKKTYCLAQFSLAIIFCYALTVVHFCITNPFPMISTFKLLFAALLSTAMHTSSAQHSIHKNSSTANAVFSISKTSNGKDKILFKRSVWDEMQKGTMFTSDNFLNNKPIKFCIEITNKELFQCRSGIGFSCSVFNCPERIGSQPLKVDAQNRICSVLLEKKDKYTVCLVFLDEVDWESLEK